MAETAGPVWVLSIKYVVILVPQPLCVKGDEGGGRGRFK